MFAAGDSKPRKPHRKSRRGCVQCKQRRVKCDEQKPACERCQKSRRMCSFLLVHPNLGGGLATPPHQPLHLDQQSTGSSSHGPLIIQNLPGSDSAVPQLSSHSISNFTILDLEILHFFITTGVFTFIDFPAGVKVFQTDVMKLAFRHPFLLYTILSLSALQLSITSIEEGNDALEKPEIYAQASDTYLATALSLFQPEISNLGKHNCDACYVFSTIMFRRAWVAQDLTRPSTLFFAADEPSPSSNDEKPAVYTIQWIKLHFGASTILHSILPLLQAGCLTPLFEPWHTVDNDINRTYPLEASETEVLNELVSSWHNNSNNITNPISPEQKETLDDILHTIRKVYSLINPKFNNHDISKISVVMAWFTWLSQDFLDMVEAKQPHALLLVVYYCVSLKKLGYLWWMRGKAENLLDTVMTALKKVDDGKWERWTTWPVGQVLG